jgi:phage repressor protein C with HTH and peptisase S24 domain
MNWNTRLTQARVAKGIKKSAFAKLVGVSAPTVTMWESGETKKIEGENLVKVCSVLDITPAWLMHGDETANLKRRAADFDLTSDQDTSIETGAIEYWEARGSCGGGYLNHENQPKGHLIKERSFFARFSVRPDNLFAIYADGDSMADFIVDGDIVIFDKTKTTPRSGKIFAIEYPDGTRIKTLRRGIDGAWFLESRNPDKRRYPDERIEPDQADLLKISGEFIYRQGG